MEGAVEVQSFDVLGVAVSATSLGFAAAKIEDWSKDDTGRFVCIRDVASLMTIIDDPSLASIHDEASMVTPDGMPLVLLGKLKGYRVERTCGSDIMELLCARSSRSGMKHYFYGGKKGVAETLAEVFKTKYPSLQIAGVECPPFRPLSAEEGAEVINRIKSSGADVVWVGISSPKQDIWMRDHYNKLSQTLVGVGAAFDFHSGEVKRAPLWMQKLGFEWLHRLMSDPKRLWHRYIVLAPKFVWRVAVDALTHNRAPER